MSIVVNFEEENNPHKAIALSFLKKELELKRPGTNVFVSFKEAKEKAKRKIIVKMTVFDNEESVDRKFWNKVLTCLCEIENVK